MKTRLLKKLRSKYASRYKVIWINSAYFIAYRFPQGNGFYTKWEYDPKSRFPKKESAYIVMDNYIRDAILLDVKELRLQTTSV